MGHLSRPLNTRFKALERDLQDSTVTKTMVMDNTASHEKTKKTKNYHQTFVEINENNSHKVQQVNLEPKHQWKIQARTLK